MAPVRAVCYQHRIHAINNHEDRGRIQTGRNSKVERKGWDYEVDEGGGAFYGPKIDIKIKDAIGR